MLIFTYEAIDLSKEHLKYLQDALEASTGQTCLVVPGCNGVYEVASEKERLDKGGK